MALAATVSSSTANVTSAEEGGNTYTRNVAIVIWNGAEILDWGGPAEVFQAAGSFGSSGGDRAFHVYTVSKTRDPIISQSFIDVIPDHSIEDAPKPDIIVLPGGGANAVRKDEAFSSWCKTAATDAEIALSVCTGAFILGDAGLLDGKMSTTWYGAVEGLGKAFPKTTVQPGRRFVDNGSVVTTAGVSAGIDGSLHLVARLLGKRVADQTAEYMEYRWAPEAYLGKNYPVLNPSLDEYGRQSQLADIHRVDENYAAAAAAYERASESENLRTNALYQAACSAALMKDKDAAITYLERAIAAGIDDFEHMSEDPDLEEVRDDPRFEGLAGVATR